MQIFVLKIIRFLPFLSDKGIFCSVTLQLFQKIHPLHSSRNNKTQQPPQVSGDCCVVGQRIGVPLPDALRI